MLGAGSGGNEALGQGKLAGPRPKVAGLELLYKVVSLVKGIMHSMNC